MEFVSVSLHFHQHVVRFFEVARTVGARPFKVATGLGSERVEQLDEQFLIDVGGTVLRAGSHRPQARRG